MKLDTQVPGRRPGRSDARRRLLDELPVSERRLQVGGMATSVLEGGEGPPVVLLHGPGVHAGVWLRVIPDLTTSHRVIAPDLPGHGGSSGPGAGARLEADRVLDWLGELIERTCPTPPVLVGQLVGGAIAARFAAEHAGRVGRLVLVVPNGLAPFEPTPAFGAALAGFLAEPNEATHDDLWHHCVFDLDALRAQPAARWDLLKAYNLDVVRATDVTDAIGALMEEFGFRPMPETTLARIDAPTALIWGRRDSIVPLSVGERASDRHGWPLLVIENAGNEPAIEAPEAFLQALRSVLASTEEQVVS